MKYQKNITEIYKELNSSIEGLSEKEAFLRLDKFGPNILEKIKKTPLVYKFLNQFTDILAIILIIAGILSFTIGDPRGGYIILIIVIINALIGFIQEYKAEKILDTFKSYLPSFTKILRNNELKKVLISRVALGDVIVLEAGDMVPADARIIECFTLQTNEFSLSGESRSQQKTTKDNDEKNSIFAKNMIFMGTSIIYGNVKAIVVATGMNTEFGKIAQSSQKIIETPTPLQKELAHTGRTVAKIAIIVALFVLILLYAFGKDFKESIIFAIVAGAAMCPEGLPAAMSIALSIGAQRMLKKNALVKKLLHVESLGSVTTICSDKTGTITIGDLTLVSVHLENDKNKQLLINNLILCNNAEINENSKGIGDSLEISLLKYAKNNNINFRKIQKENERIFEIPFSSERKIMTVVDNENNSKTNNQNYFVYSKGACLEILKHCKITRTEKERIIKENDKMANKGLRVLAYAYKEIEEFKKNDKNNIENDLIFLGLTGFEDPPREGVKDAIKICKEAGIKVFMVTGDYDLTALKISEEINLANSMDQVITGEELKKIDDNGLKELFSKKNVFARISPEQKLRIVKNLQEMNEVVAVTGDGVNDAPALVKADIGIAMGKIGTDVAKEASDMILLDDNFSTIVSAIKEGRRIFDNAKKIVFYVFSSNAGELFAPLIGILLGLPLPLLAIQILAIDLGTDVFPSLALGSEKAEPNIMKKSPRSKTERIMSYRMLSKLLKVGLVMGVMGIIVFLIALYEGGWHYGNFLDNNNPLYFQATAAVYATLVFCQFANILSCQNEKESFIKGFWSNKWVLYAELISFLMLFLIFYWPPLQSVFRTAPPSLYTWFYIILSFFIFLWIFERNKKKSGYL